MIAEFDILQIIKAWLEWSKATGEALGMTGLTFIILQVMAFGAASAWADGYNKKRATEAALRKLQAKEK